MNNLEIIKTALDKGAVLIPLFTVALKRSASMLLYGCTITKQKSVIRLQSEYENQLYWKMV